MEVTLLGSVSRLSPVSSERRLSNAVFSSLKTNTRRQTYRVTAINSVESKTHHGGVGRIRKNEDGAAVAKVVENPYSEAETASPDLHKSLSDFLEEARDFVGDDDGPPRWFSPLECSSQAQGSPLLLFIPDSRPEPRLITDTVFKKTGHNTYNIHKEISMIEDSTMVRFNFWS
ncbi:hypothetical protein YC2023_019642 [Brassica napus]